METHHLLKFDLMVKDYIKLKSKEGWIISELRSGRQEVLIWVYVSVSEQNVFDRLYEAHKRVQKVNQSLEDKLLRIVDKCETEKNWMTTEVANLTRRLVDERFNISRLQEENVSNLAPCFSLKCCGLLHYSTI